MTHALSSSTFRRSALALVVLPILALLLGGCVTSKNVARAKESGVAGTARVYAVTPDEAWDIARTVLVEWGAQELKEDRAAGYLAATSSGERAFWGVILGAWVESVTSANTRVIALSEKRLPVTFGPVLTEAQFHERFAAVLAARRAAK